ncbi:hypothetical protein ACJJTC_018360 [Scirpophaga incertulas]
MGGAVSAGRDNDELTDNLMGGNYIRTRTVERVFRVLDRADFMTPESRDQAHKDLAWRNGPLHLSAPCIYSEVMEALELKPCLSFLNVGSGTGYLSTMVGLVLGGSGISHGIEIDSYVVEYSTRKLRQFIDNSIIIDHFDFCEPKYYAGNGLCIAPLLSPYDRVYCGAGCPEQYQNYFKQLIKVGGILVMPLNDHLVQIRRTSENNWTSRNLLNVSFATLREPTKEQAGNLVKLEEIAPPRLQILARSAVREAMRGGLTRRHPELREPPPRPQPAKRVVPRRICIPIEDHADVDGMQMLHDLDQHNGGNEMNALLSLVLSMGQNRVAGALRFDRLDSVSGSERTIFTELAGPGTGVLRRLSGSFSDLCGRRRSARLLVQPRNPDPLGFNEIERSASATLLTNDGVVTFEIRDMNGRRRAAGFTAAMRFTPDPQPGPSRLREPPLLAGAQSASPPSPVPPALPSPPATAGPSRPTEETQTKSNAKAASSKGKRVLAKGKGPAKGKGAVVKGKGGPAKGKGPMKGLKGKGGAKGKCAFAKGKPGSSKPRPGTSHDVDEDEDDDEDEIPSEVEIFMRKEVNRTAIEVEQQSAEDAPFRSTRQKRQKLDSGIGDATPSTSSFGGTDSSRRSDSSDPAVTPRQTTRRRKPKRRSNSARASTAADAEMEEDNEEDEEKEEASEAESEPEARGRRRRKRPAATQPNPPLRNGVRMVRLSLAMKRGVRELPLPYPLKKYINYGRTFEF